MEGSTLKITLDKIVLGNKFTKAAGEFKEKTPGKSALVLGGTGEVGREVVKHLMASDAFDKVTVFTRRPIEYTGANAEKLVQKPVDYEDSARLERDFAGHSHAFCCLGTTRAKSGADGFYKVDHDYVVDSAKACKQANVEHYSICSSSGANKNSMFLYMKTKGQADDEIQNMGFPRVSVFRPGMLLCDRGESRLLEKVVTVPLKLLTMVAPSLLSIPTSTVAWAMVNNAFTVPATTPLNEIIGNADMHKGFDNAQKE
ncbi:Oxidoreductase htatip2 [Coemansia sp. RSA 1813]|nr:Oxidoreductase htatip2 [Coemansia sp. RSA 1646]KAJ1768375.1 Oxidoreductase htatip2 [Coemansia sp. RSA 1843]KAJ2087910.1 Oxidoreductase htatip2 [Coemansia sp. RSA 986]KAJ2212893.1 Oxidoreductase htatip2 [Coemansia sp. RSA 487]KAJ2567665.1 Oxidoreductase htatip2 [Coemansia sp. RSA 1813]